MEFRPSFLSCSQAQDIGSGKGDEDTAALSQIDPFLLEALENPRHRLTVLRMELEIKQFMQNKDQHQFEFQPFPTSYLRCAAHRVAQHYGLQTMSVDNITDGFGSRIVVRKTPESGYPHIFLSDIPLKQHENEKPEQIKIFVRRRPSEASLHDASESGNTNSMKTVEERMEEYDKARARIFSCSPDPATIGNGPYVGGDEKESKDAASRIAIFRDREKDRSDPDYDRSYDRYVSGFAPCHNISGGASNVRQPSPVMYDGGFSQLAFRPQVPPTLSSFGAFYMQWPTPAMMYSQSYEHLRNAVFQAPLYQQPLSIDHLQNS
ncbi:R3H domain-containing protein 1-like [Phalaenopsis equestris]|uniref:R3H domain-containing protein 1-like n=1 Tax=Phalaenopsis equestris TaxID=78828 RepID=UPI0009E40D71|nr:R3H domain-containing protein 1-like [Phalaenopsis equestris]